MEIKVNSEIRNYKESMFFGLSMRQSLFALCGMGVAVLLYFALKAYFSIETLSWICMLGAAPFMAMGFVIYNGMTAEQFAWVWLRSKFIEPSKVKFECGTFYEDNHKAFLREQERQAKKRKKSKEKTNAEIT